jgi:hypothetical protein
MRVRLAAWLFTTLLCIACGRTPCEPGSVETPDHACVLPPDCPEGMHPSADQRHCEPTDGATQTDSSTAGRGSLEDSVRGSAGVSGIPEGQAGNSSSSTQMTGSAGSSMMEDSDAGMNALPPSSAAGMSGSMMSSQNLTPHCGNGVVEAGEQCDGNCPTMCNTSDPCHPARLVGTKDACDARCDMDEIVACMNGDDCCPAACSATSDADCSASCGNGVVEPPELCEPTSKDKPCASSCDDGDPCTADKKSGTPERCNVACSHTPITAAMSGDGCCPSGANANTDTDCRPRCGNGVRESGETCDGDCPTCDDDGSPCIVTKTTGSREQCNVMCNHSTITTAKGGDGCCPTGANATNDSDCKPRCGNGVRESGETCDGDCPTCDDDSDPCIDTKTTGSREQCNLTCSRSTITVAESGDGCCPTGANATNDSDCKPRCGNGVRESGETCDGDCPTCDDDSDPCIDTKTTGSREQCNLTCSHPKIIAANSGDGCCPAGANANDDGDCKAKCGNRILEKGEACDVGAVSPGGDNLVPGTPYDETTCSATCERLYSYTACSLDAQCGQNGRCLTGFCTVTCDSNASITTDSTDPYGYNCRLTNGRSGLCLGGLCYMKCGDTRDSSVNLPCPNSACTPLGGTDPHKICFNPA